MTQVGSASAMVPLAAVLISLAKSLRLSATESSPDLVALYLDRAEEEKSSNEVGTAAKKLQSKKSHRWKPVRNWSKRVRLNNAIVMLDSVRHGLASRRRHCLADWRNKGHSAPPTRRSLRMNPGKDQPYASECSFHDCWGSVGILTDNRTPAG